MGMDGVLGEINWGSRHKLGGFNCLKFQYIKMELIEFTLLDKIKNLSCKKHESAIKFLNFSKGNEQPQCGDCTMSPETIQIKVLEARVNEYLRSVSPNDSKFSKETNMDSLKLKIKDLEMEVRNRMLAINYYVDKYCNRLSKIKTFLDGIMKDPVVEVTKKYSQHVSDMNESMLKAFIGDMQPYLKLMDNQWFIQLDINYNTAQASSYKNAITILKDAALYTKQVKFMPQFDRNINAVIVQNACSLLNVHLVRDVYEFDRNSKRLYNIDQLIRKHLEPNYISELFDHLQISGSVQSKLKKIFENQIQTLVAFAYNIIRNKFNETNFSLPENKHLVEQYIRRYQYDKRAQEFLFTLLQLNSLCKEFTIGGSNAIYLLNRMKFDFSGRNLEGIRISKTDISGCSFLNVRLANSCFEEVNISGCDFTNADLSDVRWTKMRATEIASLNSHTDNVKCVQISKDGQFIFSGGEDKQLICTALTAESKRDQFQAHKSGISSIAVSPDRRLLAIGTQDGSIKVIDEKSRKKNFHQKQVLQGEVLSLQFTKDSSRFLIASSDTIFYTWNSDNGNEISRFIGHNGPISQAIYSPCYCYILSGGQDYSIRLWDASSGKQQMIYYEELEKLDNDQGSVSALAFHPGGEFFASGTWDSLIRIWRKDKAQSIKKLHGHSGIIYSLQYSPDGNTLASSSQDSSIRFWDHKTGNLIRKLCHPFGGGYSLTYTPDGKFIAAANDDRKIRLWKADLIPEINRTAGHSGFVQSVCILGDQRRIVSGSADRTVRVWDAKSGKEIHKLECHTGFVRAVACQSSRQNQNLIASGGDDQVVRLWDAEKGQLVRELQDGQEAVWSLAFSSCGQRLAAGCGDGFLWVWDVDSKNPAKKYEGHTGRVLSVAFKATDNLVASVSPYMVKVLNLLDNKSQEKQIEKGSLTSYESASWTSNGKYLVVSRSDWKVEWLRGASLTSCFILDSAHKGTVFSAQCSLDGKYLITVGQDNLIKVWDEQYFEKQIADKESDQKVQAVALKELQQLKAHTGTIFSVAISADSRTIFTGSADNTIRIWRSHEEKKKRGGNIWHDNLKCLGDTVLTQGEETQVELWDEGSGDRLNQLYFGSTAGLEECLQNFAQVTERTTSQASKQGNEHFELKRTIRENTTLLAQGVKLIGAHIQTDQGEYNLVNTFMELSG